ncbi:A disintegrin and metalloproteinase with thrombospondin motifs 9-like [Lampetra planeri]
MAVALLLVEGSWSEGVPRVASIYKHPSVGNQINIVLVKLMIIHNEREGPLVNFNAASTLSNFCVWQQKQNTQDESHPGHYDTAVLITRENICRARNKCDTLGLAELGTMCDPYRSCSISEDNGLSTAFTVAHEIGHVFNMPHDDNNKCREAGVKGQFHVMAPTLNYNTSPWTWSRCSRKYITEFLDTGYGECLLDEPVSQPYELPKQMPGHLFNANKQCELMFGPGSQVCPYMKQCKRLWCTSAEGIHKGCRTQHMPLADGTECGFFMHCVQGMCVAREAPARVVDGSWGSWGPFTPCSRSCGGGVRSSERDCGKPEPRNGGNYCVGRRMRFRSCSTEPCPKGRRDFRDDQCSEFDGRHFNINGLSPTVRWVSKYSGILLKDRCKLFCRVTGTTAYYQLRDRVMDGTPCGPDTNDICVQGLCRKAGCDHVLNSKARKDRCGVCGGDNSSCHTVSGTFNSVQYGYNEVVRIPAGSMNIEVRQHSYSGKADDDNYLAVRSGQGGYLLNGNFVVSVFKREVRVRDATIDYTGSDTAVERLNCSQRIDEEVVIMVLSVGNLHSPDIRYSFSIPTEEKAQRYAWDTDGAWQECSRTCRGEQHGKVVCVRESDRLVVSEQRCHHLRRPEPLSQGCNTECELRWHVAGRSECSAQCGPGQRSLEVRCVRYGPAKARSDVVDDRHCAELPKPAAREPCHGDCHLTSWQYTSWSQCSQSCAGGARTRDAACVNNLGRRVSNQECDANQRVTSQSCNERPCPQWVASEWTECTATCGKGVRHRRVHCLRGEETLEETFCDAGARPEAMGTCELPECASWQAGPWGPCSVTCGRGYQMRAMRCFSGFYSTILDDRECNAATRPTETQDCEQTTCSAALPDLTPSPLSYLQRQQQSPTQWRYGSWTPCSASCGKGLRQRYVSCRDVHGGIGDPSACLHLTRPPETEPCVATTCGQWRAGDWTVCPVPCGLGRVTRQVLCISHALQLLDESECDGGERPPAERECSGPPCPVARHGYPAPGTEARPPGPPEPRPFPGYGPQRDYSLVKGAMPSSSSSRGGGRQWRTGPWGACSSTCAGGIHRRVVVCQDENGYADYHCEERHRPSETQACDAGPCPEWNYGSWGECTKTCGGGTRSRAVLCQLPSGQPLAEQSCEVLERPTERQQCGAHPCPPGRAQDHWHRGAWTPS